MSRTGIGWDSHRLVEGHVQQALHDDPVEARPNDGEARHLSDRRDLHGQAFLVGDHGKVLGHSDRRHHHEQGQPRHLAREEPQQVKAGGVRPVQVLEYQHQ